MTVPVILSTMNIQVATTTTAPITTHVEEIASSRLGQATLVISAFTSPKNTVTICSHLTSRFPLLAAFAAISPSFRRFLSMLCNKERLAGQEGLEPSTPGFGVRCTANCATALRPLFLTGQYCLFTFSVQSMLSAEAAVLLELHPLGMGSFVLGSGVISTLALCACQCRYNSHR